MSRNTATTPAQRLALRAIHTASRRHRDRHPPRPGRFAEAERLFRQYLGAAARHEFLRPPRLAPPNLAPFGSQRPSRDERRLLRAIAAAQAGDDLALDNQIYKLALDRQHRAVLAAAVRAWAASLAQPHRTITMAHATTGLLEQPGAPATETALLWAIRTWVACRRAETPVEPVLDPVFARLGAPDAAAYFHGLMWVIQHGAARRIAIACPCRPAIGPDEQTLLDALAATQAGQSFERLLLLRTLLRPIASTPAGESAAGLVAALNRAGLFFAAGATAVRRYALPSVHSDLDFR